MSTIERDAVRILPEYVVDNLGGSFKVILVDSAKCRYDENTGKERIDIPDYDGLIGAIATLRAINDRKLSGRDIKFLRKHLGMKAKDLAVHLDVSPEHLSRCENEEKVLSGNSEKILRLLVLSRPFHVLENLMTEADKNDPKKLRALVSYAELISEIISKMKIASVYNDISPIVFRLNFRSTSSSCYVGNDNDDGNWHHPKLPSSIAA